MDKPLIIIGAGGHAKVLIDALNLLARRIVCAVDANPERHGETIANVPIPGGDEQIFKFQPEDILLVQALGSTRSCAVRQAVFQTMKQKGYHFAQVIHPAAVVARSARLGEGVQIMAGAVVQPDCMLGDNVLINTRASIDHDCRIDAHTHIAPGATLSGNVHVGQASHIGIGTSVIENRQIGSGVLIGAGSVVVSDIPDNVVAYGVPARVIKAAKRQA